jgi:hypothetical protein
MPTMRAEKTSTVDSDGCRVSSTAPCGHGSVGLECFHGSDDVGGLKYRSVKVPSLTVGVRFDNDEADSQTEPRL